ncbi:GNAT family N-acetyltransferase [Secundilactobacillus folii]|uniref:GNAT family N-acetyltransferase n=1 Tax=Secundilactobacillus folii TaxID=2678357 RepID=A0A7X2XTM8_9LACO|nr:GNAT family N-acetyltransferase [Secundilactobacillus folii]MTV81457.1 GNAT family N-acetyltransferase [Secundilactobacillus folii]
MKISFKYAKKKDLPTITAIYNQVIPSRMATADLDPVSVESKQDWFAAFDPQKRPIWVLKDDGKIAGWVSLESFYGRPAYLHTTEISIYIDKKYRHKGLGQQALEFVFGQLKTLDIDTLVAFIFHHNVPSLGLFKKNGFETWGHLPNVAEMDGQLRSLDILGRRFKNN